MHRDRGSGHQPDGSILNIQAIFDGWGHLVFDAATFADVDQFMQFAATDPGRATARLRHERSAR